MGYDGSSSLKRVSPAKKIGIAGIDFTNLTSGNNINKREGVSKDEKKF